MMASTTEEEFVDALKEAIELYDDAAGDADYDVRILRAKTFHDVGMLTVNQGLVVLLTDGSEFQVTVVRSK